MRDHDWIALESSKKRDWEICICRDCGCIARQRLRPDRGEWEYFPIGKFWVWVWQPCSLQPWMVS